MLQISYTYIKKIIKNESKDNQHFNSRLFKSFKIMLKFIASVLQLKSYKLNKIKSLYISGYGGSSNNNLNSSNNSNTQKANLIAFVKDSKDYYSSFDKIQKLISDIKFEEEARNKNNRSKAIDFFKTLDKLKKYCCMSVPLMSLSKCYKMMKILTDLILTYIKEN